MSEAHTTSTSPVSGHPADSARDGRKQEDLLFGIEPNDDKNISIIWSPGNDWKGGKIRGGHWDGTWLEEHP